MELQIFGYSLSELSLIHGIATSMVVMGGLMYLAPKAEYGRYSSQSYKINVSARIAWIIQECPSFFIPLFIVFKSDCRYLDNIVNKILLGLFMFHYFQRTFIFSLLIRGSKPTPLNIVLYAIVFCTGNGYVQGRFLTHYALYPANWLTDSRFLIGCGFYLIGFLINVHSDYILRNLRKPGETGYKIPHGGMFEYVSAANYFGEILEWFGYALASWSFPSLAFACSTLGVIGMRGYHHHRDYLKKFDNYPKNRKAVIPFLL